jgi:hypothetical protein
MECSAVEYRCFYDEEPRVKFSVVGEINDPGQILLLV